MKRIVLALTLTGVLAAGSCDDAAVVSSNLSKAADNFEVNRRIVFYNGITDKYLLTIEGRCSIDTSNSGATLYVICKVADGQFKKHFLGLSDNVTYFAEQGDPVAASDYHYRVTFKPQAILPDVDFRGSIKALTTNSSEASQ